MGLKRLFSKNTRQTPEEQSAADQERQASLPEGSLVVFPRHLNQAAFEENIRGLAGLFFEGGGAGKGPQIVVLSGAEGSGKTQLAVEFAYRYAQRFDGVHWLDGAGKSCPAAEIAQFSPVLKLPFESENVLEQAESVLLHWRGGNHLLILDQLEQAERWTDWIDRLGSSCVLVSSQQEQWTSRAGVWQVHMNPLNGGESSILLRGLALRFVKARDVDLEEMADYLGWLPISMHLAARYLEENGRLAINAYLARLEKTKGQLPPALTSWARSQGSPRLEELAAAAELNLQHIQGGERVESLAWQIFWLCGCCAPGLPIPLALLKKATRYPEDDPALFDKTLQRLYQFRLLSASDEGPIIHPLLANFARLRENRDTAGLARLAEALFTFDSLAGKKKTFRGTMLFRAHLESAAQLAEEAGLKQAGRLWATTANHLLALGEPERARTAYEQAISIDEKLSGSEENQLAIELSGLARARAELGDRQGAKTSLERAIAIVEKNSTLKYSTLATYTRQLGQVLLELGDLAGAKVFLERALSSHESSYGYGPKHREVAIDAESLGLLYEKRGDFHEAKGCYERALSINENIFVYGPDHQQVARNLNSLARVQRELGDLAGAKISLERALRINEKIYGPYHVEVKRSLAILAPIYQDSQDYRSAQTFLERVLAINEKMAQQPNTEIAGDLYRLGLVLRAQGSMPEAQACFRRALAIEEKLRGPEHPNISVNLYNLGRILHELRDLQGAKDCYERTLAIDKKIYGLDHPYTATDINNLGGILHDLQDLTGAKACFQQALEIDEKISGAEHPNVARDLNNLGSVYKDMGKLSESFACFERAFEIFKTYAGPDHPNTRVVYENLLSVRQKMQQSGGRTSRDGRGR